MGFQDFGDGLWEAVIQKADVICGVCHGLEEARFVVEADGVFVAPARGHGHVVDGEVDGEGGFLGAETGGDEFHPTSGCALLCNSFALTLIFLFAKDLAKDELIANDTPLHELGLESSVMIKIFDSFDRTNDVSGVEKTRSIIKSCGISIRIRSI